LKIGKRNWPGTALPVLRRYWYEKRKGRKNVTGVTEREMKENTGYRERGCTDGLKIL
jgi:hypothetical protein